VSIVHAANLTQPSGLELSSLPDAFRLFAFGVNKTSKGDFVLDAEGAKSILAARALAGVDLAIDYEHQTFASLDNGKPAPAAGWCQLELRPDGIWAANVRWTEAAAAMLRAKEYRYFSPTFEVDKSNRITKLLPLALTNLPASRDLQALVAAKTSGGASLQTEKTKMTIANLIGLKDDAAEADVESRVLALKATETRLLEITGKDNVADAIGVVIAAKDATVKLATAEQSLREWQEAHASAEAAKAKSAITALVAGAADKKHYGVPREEFVRMASAHGETYGVPALETLLASYPDRVRHIQVPVPVNTPAEQLRAVDEYQKAHPGATKADAYVALNAERPTLFAEGGR
jgi:phage I-like protein